MAVQDFQAPALSDERVLELYHARRNRFYTKDECRELYDTYYDYPEDYSVSLSMGQQQG